MLIGALSLVNHACGAPLAFGKPARIPVGIENVPAFATNGGDCMMLEVVDAFEDDACVWKASECV